MIKTLKVAIFSLLGLLVMKPKPVHAFDPNAFTTIRANNGETYVTNSSFTVDTNESGGKRISISHAFSPVAFSTMAFTDGRPSTATIQISSNTALQAATGFITITVTTTSILYPTTAWITITIASNSQLNGASFIFNQGNSSYTFQEGRDWSNRAFSTFTSVPAPPDFSSATAMSIVNAISFSSYNVVASTPNAFMQKYISTGTQDGSASIVVLRAVVSGIGYNNWSITSSTQFALTVSYSTGNNSRATSNPVGVQLWVSSPIAFSPGREPHYLILNTTGSYKFAYGKDIAFDAGEKSSQTAQNIATALNKPAYGVTASTTFVPNGFPTQLLGGAAAGPNALSGLDPSVAISTHETIVVVRTIFPGKYSSDWSITSSTQFGITVGKSTNTTGTGNPRLGSGTSYFLEGRDAVQLKVASQTFTAGVDFFIQMTSSGTAAALSDALMSVFQTSGTFVSTFTLTAQVTSTMNYVQGIATYSVYDFPVLWTSSNSFLLLGGSTFTSRNGIGTSIFMQGVPTQIDTFTFTISSATPSFGFKAFETGAVLVFSTPAAGVPPPSPNLVDGASYFAIVTRNSNGTTGIQLALTSTGAFAGVPIPISTQAVRATGVGNTFTLKMQTNNQATNIRWFRSNDNATWFTVPQASFTIVNNSPLQSTTYYDLGEEDARYLRFTIEASSNMPTSVRTTIQLKR